MLVKEPLLLAKDFEGVVATLLLSRFIEKGSITDFNQNKITKLF